MAVPDGQDTRQALEALRIIAFDERPALDHTTASEQLEHLYIHVGLTQEKLNEVIAALAAVRDVPAKDDEA